MRPETIAVKERTFADNLMAGGVKYADRGQVDIGGGMSFRSIRPPYQSYYYQTESAKKAICLHFTVGYIMSDIAALSKEGNHVSVSYVVDRGGRIYELFPDRYWSYHLGSGAAGGNAAMSKQTIGIEISNYGPLSLTSGKMVDCYGNEYCREDEAGYYDACDYRGKKFYATMSAEQEAAVAALVKYLCAKHSIPLEFAMDGNVFPSAEAALGFSGVMFHTNVRKDKFDWPMTDSVMRMVGLCTAAEPEPEEEPEEVAEETPAEPVEEPAEKPVEPPPASTPPVRTPPRKPWWKRILDALESFLDRL